MKAKIFSIEGTLGKEIELPTVFDEAVRPDLINRAVLSLQSKQYQKKGTDPLAGVRTSAAYFGRRGKVYRTSMNIGKARLPKLKLPEGNLGEVRRVPHSRKGRRAHPPKTDKIIIEKINRKENKKAIMSAISATSKQDIVQKRGHLIEGLKVPLIIEDKFETVTKTQQVFDILSKMKLGNEIKKSSKKKIKAGRGKMRGRKYRQRKTVLIVVKDKKTIEKAAKNIPGVDISNAKDLNASVLAPGGHPGRLTIYTESAINEIGKIYKW